MKPQKKLLKLEELQVESFVTSLSDQEKETIQGGTTETIIYTSVKVIRETIKWITKPENWCTVNVTCITKVDCGGDG